MEEYSTQVLNNTRAADRNSVTVIIFHTTATSWRPPNQCFENSLQHEGHEFFRIASNNFFQVTFFARFFCCIFSIPVSFFIALRNGCSKLF